LPEQACLTDEAVTGKGMPTIRAKNVTQLDDKEALESK
jgi:hypothetical protein